MRWLCVEDFVGRALLKSAKRTKAKKGGVSPGKAVENIARVLTKFASGQRKI